MAAPIAACSSDNEVEVQTDNNRSPKTLVAYFSATNNTKQVADEITRILGADEFRMNHTTTCALPSATCPLQKR